MPALDSPCCGVELGYRNRLQCIFVDDAQDVETTLPWNFQVCPVNAKGKVFVRATL